MIIVNYTIPTLKGLPVMLLRNFATQIRCLNRTVAITNNVFDENRKYYSKHAAQIKQLTEEQSARTNSSLDLRFSYREFLPDPNMEWRNAVREKLERGDMIKRRTHIDIPEFYVGSIIAVKTSDFHSAGKENRFVGICIHREGCGLRAKFILRNVIDHQGIEVMYEMYDPTVRSIEVLRLEKRLDDKLFYLRDALPEYSTFDVDMEPEMLPENSSIPTNQTKVKLKPKPWLERWERQELKGVDGLIYDDCRAKPWEKYDLMKQYKATIPAEEQNTIFTEVHSQLHQLEIQRKKMKRKRTFVTPKKLA